ncbi:type VI secretion system tube protein TssD [Zobellia galactanivorans]|uniref:type VI secretion system tube protein TssD n=1 Tax=Zobellia galactanivorans (strain DSM 12802 / CCUG 47099 / CIP 106680 / NCIMB 13871 / Dsij) TaxID=63186 RepID=UPI001C079181|nr:type VI secretion system tube protein TssD [Zobellia galactanivorans]MBU3024779.1 hypothetical protein [Zobellia galactanivorans]
MAKLFINGKTTRLLDTNVQFYQQINPSTFKPTSVPMGGIFTITIEAGTNTDLLRLMVSSDGMCNGFIRFYKKDETTNLVEYEFFDTYIVGYCTEFESISSRPMTDKVIFSPGILRIGDMVFEKPWKVTELKAKSDETSETVKKDFNIGPEID